MTTSSSSAPAREALRSRSDWRLRASASCSSSAATVYRAGEDPLEPCASGPYPHPPVSHEPKIAEPSRNLRSIGLHPFHLPLGILLDEKPDGTPTPTSTCMRCSHFDGFPCLLNGKADAQVICVDPMLAAHPNVALLTGAYVSKLGTDASGRKVDAVHVTRNGQDEVYTADIVADDFESPNGFCFSPDERLLYVSESGQPFAPDPVQYVRMFDVADNGARLANGRVFCKVDCGFSDGIRCDEVGNLWSSAGVGVH